MLIGRDTEECAVVTDCLGQPPATVERDGQVTQGFGIRGVQLDRLPERGKSLSELSGADQDHSEVVPKIGSPGLEHKGSAEQGRRTIEIGRAGSSHCAVGQHLS
jgi:hypothetical protein